MLSVLKTFVLSSMLPRFFYAGEEGVSGAPAAEPMAPELEESSLSAEDVATISDDIATGDKGFDEFNKAALENDPEYAEMLKAEKAPEERVPAKKDPEPKDPNATVPDPKKPEEPVEEEIAFEDDVIPGLKGEELKKLSPEAQTALAEHYEKASEAIDSVGEARATAEKLLKDPVVAFRQKMSENQRFAVRGMNAEEETSLQTVYGFTEEETGKLKGGLQKIAQSMAQDMVHNYLIEENAERQIQETTQKSYDILLGLGKINSEFALEGVKDLKEIFDKGERHPQWKKYQNGIGKVMAWAASKKISHPMVVEMGADAFYAAAATSLGMPVIRNADETLKKVAMTARMNTLKPFLKSTKPKTLDPSQSSVSQPAKASNSPIIQNGIDMQKLAGNTPETVAYYEKLLGRKFGDREWMDKINGMRDRAQRIHSKTK